MYEKLWLLMSLCEMYFTAGLGVSIHVYTENEKDFGIERQEQLHAGIKVKRIKWQSGKLKQAWMNAFSWIHFKRLTESVSQVNIWETLLWLFKDLVWNVFYCSWMNCERWTSIFLDECLKCLKALFIWGTHQIWGSLCAHVIENWLDVHCPKHSECSLAESSITDKCWLGFTE